MPHAIGYVPQASGVDVSATGRESLWLRGQVQRSKLTPDWGRVALYLGLLLAFVAATSALATRAFRVYRRTL